MRVEEIMNQNPLTIEAHVTVDCALQKLLSSRVRHLPVIENERLVGIVSDRDILKSVRKQREAKNEGEKVRAVM
ncbi:CBS domain-containing protein, partial [Helcococcus ovis]|uniref:CBS domain-containing protein n=1 Tax=Helcococcus ovis TaxID=72026 RepID=UPI00106FA36F